MIRPPRSTDDPPAGILITVVVMGLEGLWSFVTSFIVHGSHHLTALGFAIVYCVLAGSVYRVQPFSRTFSIIVSWLRLVVGIIIAGLMISGSHSVATGGSTPRARIVFDFILLLVTTLVPIYYLTFDGETVEAFRNAS